MQSRGLLGCRTPYALLLTDRLTYYCLTDDYIYIDKYIPTDRPTDLAPWGEQPGGGGRWWSPLEAWSFVSSTCWNQAGLVYVALLCFILPCFVGRKTDKQISR